MLRLRHAIAILAAACVLAMGQAGPAKQVPGIKLIVHPSSPLQALSAAQVSRIFLKKDTQWKDGTKILPVDLDRKSRVRERFSKLVHGKSVAAVEAYWQNLIFTGRGVPLHRNRRTKRWSSMSGRIPAPSGTSRL